MAVNVRCQCGAQVTVPRPGLYVQCPSCKRMVTAPACRSASPAPNSEMVPLEPEPPATQNPCPRCGVPMTAGARVCLACGYGSVGTFTRYDEPAPQKTSPVKLVVLLIVAVLIIGGAIAGIVLTKTKPTQPMDPGHGYLPTVLHAPKHVREVLSMAEVQQSIQSFAALEGRYPKGLDELAQHGMGAPPPPQGFEYDYNPENGQVKLKPVDPAKRDGAVTSPEGTDHDPLRGMR